MRIEEIFKKCDQIISSCKELQEALEAYEYFKPAMDAYNNYMAIINMEPYTITTNEIELN